MRPVKDRLVVDSRIDHRALGQVKFVHLAHLQRGIGVLQVPICPEPLHSLGRQVAIGHRMANHQRRQVSRPDGLCRPPRRLALARSGAHRANCDHRNPRHQHRFRRPASEKDASAAVTGHFDSRMRAPGGRFVLQCSVRPVRVVAVDILTEDQAQILAQADRASKASQLNTYRTAR